MTVYYVSLEEVINNSSDGSYVKLLSNTDEFGDSYNFDKAITFDLNGHEIVQPSSRSIDVSANVRFTDSKGGGFLSFSLRLASPCIFEGGIYTFISIDFETDKTMIDFIGQCSKAYVGYTDELINLTGTAKYLRLVEFKIEHNIIDETCISYKCFDCGQTFEHKNDELHSFANYQVSKEATCQSDKEETAVCEHCKTVTDTRKVLDSKLEHEDSDNDYVCDYGCGMKFEVPDTNTSDGTIEKDFNSGCGGNVMSSIFGVVLLLGLIALSRFTKRKKVK